MSEGGSGPMNDSQLRPTLFGRISERCVTFCIDTSGSMYSCLESVKEHLIEALENLARREQEEEMMFNVIEFSTSVVQWADRMVRCTPETVAVAAQWIRNLMPKTGTNTLDALLSAFSDKDCNAVYLVTDSVPDTNVEDVLNAVVSTAGNRPVHAIYIQSVSPDPAAVNFLRELSMETYGSFHVVSITPHGAIERTTPIYRAEAAAERIVRTTDGNIYPSNHKLCSVTSSLSSIDPHIIPYSPILLPSYTGVIPPYTLGVPPPYPYYLYPWPYRYYYYCTHPGGSGVGWSRYRPAKAWLKHAHEFIDGVVSLTPGAGSLLIGTNILARRHADGFLYKGTAKSQILGNKFLVEFGPCKHGRFNDFEYQETYVYDIVSLDDALRHPVLTDDKVLAPWEPEGERYAPGIVIDGQEKRIAKEDGIVDKPVVVTFYDGRTVTIERDRAIWIPHDLHERITFELKLPRNVRKQFAEQDRYPQITAPGYPASGPQAFPTEFPQFTPPGWIPASNTVALNAYYGRPFVPVASHRPVQFTRPESGGGEGGTWGRGGSSSSVRSEDMEKLIPGTDMTREELNRKVMSQITNNKTLLEERRNNAQRNGEREVGERRGENGRGGNERGERGHNGGQENELRKSVSFADRVSECGTEREDISGAVTDGSLSDLDLETLSDTEGGGVHSPRGGVKKLLHRRKSQRSRSSERNRQWKYWNTEPSPSLRDPLHYGPYRTGPYRDGCSGLAGVLRDGNKNMAASVEWTSPMYNVVDSLARYRHDQTVKDCLVQPKQPYPPYKPPKQGPGKDISLVIGEHQLQQELIADARNDYRQSELLKREIGHQKQVADVERNRQLYEDYRRQVAANQINREQERHLQEERQAQRSIEAKRYNRAQVMTQQSSKEAEALSKEEWHIAAKKFEREKRIVSAAQAQVDAERAAAQRYAMKELQSIARVEAQGAKVLESASQQAVYQANRAQRQAANTAHFRQLESEAQKRKEFNAQVKDQQMAIYRASVLP